MLGGVEDVSQPLPPELASLFAMDAERRAGTSLIPVAVGAGSLVALAAILRSVELSAVDLAAAATAGLIALGLSWRHRGWRRLEPDALEALERASVWQAEQHSAVAGLIAASVTGVAGYGLMDLTEIGGLATALLGLSSFAVLWRLIVEQEPSLLLWPDRLVVLRGPSALSLTLRDVRRMRRSLEGRAMMASELGPWILLAPHRSLTWSGDDDGGCSTLGEWVKQATPQLAEHAVQRLRGGGVVRIPLPDGHWRVHVIVGALGVVLGVFAYLIGSLPLAAGAAAMLAWGLWCLWRDRHGGLVLEASGVRSQRGPTLILWDELSSWSQQHPQVVLCADGGRELRAPLEADNAQLIVRIAERMTASETD